MIAGDKASFPRLVKYIYHHHRKKRKKDGGILDLKFWDGMFSGAPRRFFIYLFYLTIFILITFAPHLYAKVKDLNSIQSFMEIFDPVAIATILLAAATFALVKDSSRNIEVSKNSLIKEYLTREMEQLIKPLYNKRDRFEYYESAYAFSSSTDNFWKEIENNKYMATKNLRESIEDYLKENKELRQNLNSIESNIRGTYRKEKNQLPSDFLTIFNQCGNISGSHFNIGEVPLELKKLIGELNDESEIRLELKKYIDIVENNSVAITRLDLRNKVIERYKKLEKKLDEIRESLEEI